MGKIQLIDAEILYYKPLEHPKMLIDGILSDGLAILAGDSKIGKSWMVLWMCLQISKGEPLWGLPTRKTDVVYLALEDRQWRVQQRMQDLTDTPPDNLHFGFSCGQVGAELESQIEDVLKDYPSCGLIFIDTLQMVRDNVSAKANAYAKDYKDLSALKKIADDHGICIFVVHHTRKERDGGNIFNDMTGSTGIMGVADTGMILRKDERFGDNATLCITGRDVEERKLKMQMKGVKWEITEELSADDLRKERVPDFVFQVVDYLLAHRQFQGTITELLTAVGNTDAGFDADGELYCNQRFGDWPRAIPDGKMDSWAPPAWNLLSYGKTVTASSFMLGREPARATDEDAHTWWRAASNNPGEWLCVDLGREMDVHAIQINFADEGITVPERVTRAKMREGRYIDEIHGKTRWLLEGSLDGERFFPIEDKSMANTDLPHDLVIREEKVSCRYVKLTVFEMPYNENPCVSGLRIFGHSDINLPEEASFIAGKISPTQFRVAIENAAGVLGYEILWGNKAEKLYHSCTLYRNFELPYASETVGALVADEDYYIRVDTFNEAGITKGQVRELGDMLPCVEKLSGIDTLLVDGLPYFARGGEIHNSSASSLAYMDENVWQGIEGLNLNTLLVPMYWEQIEPAAGEYCFDMLDGIIEGARKRNLRLGILWFGLWKNAESAYAPVYIKKDPQRYFLAKDANGRSLNTVSPFCSAAVERDKLCFTALMSHLKEIDRYKSTVIFVQVENEVGLLGTDRDYCDAANLAFLEQGNSGVTGEAFMARAFASAVEEIASAGRDVYPLPCYTNAWLKQFPWYPGSYPSGGPVSVTREIWQECGPSLFALAPDIYEPYAADVMDEYHKNGNPLIVPETRKDAWAASYELYAFLGNDALCFSPFGIEDLGMGRESLPSEEILKSLNISPIMYATDGGKEALGAVNKLLTALEPLYLKYRGTGNIRTFIKRRESDRGELIEFERYSALVSFMDDETGEPLSAGAIFKLRDDEFMLVAMRCQIKFYSHLACRQAKATRACEIDYEKNYRRWLNGDEQMPFVFGDKPTVIKVELYEI